MASTAELDPTILFPFVVVMLVMSLFLWLAILGGSLKLSFVMLSSEPPSYLRCLLAAVLMLVINIGVFVAVLAALGPQPWYIVTAYQFMLQTFVVCLVVKRNPIVSLVATFLHSLLAGAGTVAIALMIIISTGSALSGFKERGSLFFAKAQEATNGATESDPSLANSIERPEATPASFPLPASVSGVKTAAPMKSATGVTSNPFIQ